MAGTVNMTVLSSKNDSSVCCGHKPDSSGEGWVCCEWDHGPNPCQNFKGCPRGLLDIAPLHDNLPLEYFTSSPGGWTFSPMWILMIIILIIVVVALYVIVIRSVGRSKGRAAP